MAGSGGGHELTHPAIDVQAELRAKTGSPSLGPAHVPQGMAQPPTVQRAIMNRHHQARRSNSSIAPKLEPSAPLGNPSPQSRPTPSSHHSSPSATSPGFGPPGVMTPPASDTQIHQQQHPHPQQRMNQPRSAHQPLKPHVADRMGLGPGVKGQMSDGNRAMGGGPTASFYHHIEQLGKLTRPFLSGFALKGHRCEI